jgi:hypothetical protein
MTDQSSGPVPTNVMAAEERLRPRTWWQWIVLFPALATALFTALPQWIDSIRGLMAGFKDRGYEEVMESRRLFARNTNCNVTTDAFNPTTAGFLVDATLCPSGDLFVRVREPNETSPIATGDPGAKYVEWSDYVGIEKIVEKAARLASMDMLGMAAFAGTVPQQAPALSFSADDFLLPAQAQGNHIICQKFVDDRMLLRHVEENGQCFDETVDTFSGLTVSRVSVPCRTEC